MLVISFKSFIFTCLPVLLLFQYSGPSKDALAYAEWVKEDNRFSDILVQISPAVNGHAFPKLKLRYKPSLVQASYIFIFSLSFSYSCNFPDIFQPFSAKFPSYRLKRAFHNSLC